MKFILYLFIIFLPWKLKRFCLTKFFKYNIHPSARIGFSFVLPKHLIMEEKATIGHFNVAIHLNLLHIGKNSHIVRSNWITGFPTDKESKHFAHDKDRKSELIIGKETAITKKHHLDCTNTIKIGDYVTIAGYNSQFLTHSIDVYENRQDSHPIIIGDYCFVSTGVIVLGGSKLPSYSVLAAGSVLNKELTEEWSIYGGIPTKLIKAIPKDAKYFTRTNGFVY